MAYYPIRTIWFKLELVVSKEESRANHSIRLFHFDTNSVIERILTLALIRILTLLSNLDTLKDTLRIMTPSYLVHRKSGSSYLFRSVIPLDL